MIICLMCWNVNSLTRSECELCGHSLFPAPAHRDIGMNHHAGQLIWHTAPPASWYAEDLACTREDRPDQEIPEWRRDG